MTVIIALETLMLGLMLGAALAVDIMLRAKQPRQSTFVLSGIQIGNIGRTVRLNAKDGWQFVSHSQGSRSGTFDLVFQNGS